ncbi:MAG: preprotein translocase subunit SecA [Candidatus Wolfebacteria bacterium]|nr:preprotein translocase subunit SecA [Candidatus Wolfebacteria bacterium]
MKNFLKSFLGKQDFSAQVKKINLLEDKFKNLSDDELKEKSIELKNQIKEKNDLDKIIEEAFALVRESAKRNLRQRHFDVQLIGGLVLHQSKIAEMATGEGKTLAATSPIYLNSLLGKGAHAITVNDYLARRDAVWMGQIYWLLGMTVGCLTHDQAFLYDPLYKPNNEGEKDKERDALGSFKVVSDFLRPASRKEAYLADITYGTINEFGFDYLRDNLAHSKEDQVQREHYFAIIDEVDSILIDEARTPLIISAPDVESSNFYKVFAKVAANLLKEEDYSVDEKLKSVLITENGINKVERMLNIKDLYGPENARLIHYLEESLKAKALFHKDKKYVVKNGEVIIVDEFTGRLMPGRRYSAGLHQAIEAKEGVEVKEESRTYAQITIQNYFKLYEKISGMTGTAQTSAEEFDKVYGLEVVSIPTNKPTIRKDKEDLIYKNLEVKYKAIISDIKKRYEAGQPVLIGTGSIQNNEIVSAFLSQANIPHEVLNAKNHEREGEIIAQAGKLKAVTVATNMAGRGVDIILGGNPPSPETARIVKEAGGLHVIGTERHEARRIDNQLRGRSGRQGDHGSSQFFLSLEDDLLRIFGGERVRKLMETFNLPEDEPIESSMISKVVNEAQKKIEGMNFDSRKHLLDYDNVLNKQRDAVYKKRQEIIESNAKEIFKEIAFNSWERIKNNVSERDQLEKILTETGILEKEELEKGDIEALVENKINGLITEENQQEIKFRLLGTLDMFWMTHLENLEALLESVGIRAYGQHDPLVEYRREAHQHFKNLFANFEDTVFQNIWRILKSPTGNIPRQNVPVKNISATDKKVGRNDPCPCGAINSETGKVYKWKQCGLINASHHK